MIACVRRWEEEKGSLLHPHLILPVLGPGLRSNTISNEHFLSSFPSLSRSDLCGTVSTLGSPLPLSRSPSSVGCGARRDGTITHTDGRTEGTMGSRTQKKKGKRKRGKMPENASLSPFFLSVHPDKSTVYRK